MLPRTAVGACLLSMFLVASAFAQSPDTGPDTAPPAATQPAAAKPPVPPPVVPDPGPLPGLAATIPGLIVHGTGTWLAGDHHTAAALRRTELLALGTFALGAVPFGASGASRRLAGLSMPFILAGGGMFIGSWLADLYGATTGGRPHASARQQLPPIEAQLGYAYIYDPQFDYASFAVVAADIRPGQWRLSPSAWVAIDHDTQRLRLEAARYLRANDGSFLAAEAAATWHRQGTDGFTVYTPELGVRGRYDLRRIGFSLAGSYFELQLGWGVEIYDIDDSPLTLLGMQTARAAYGLYLGDGRGEAQFYYDHRHDEFAAGLATGWLFDGPWGHFGLSGFYYFTPTVGISSELEAGGAYVGRLSLLVSL